MAGQKNVQAKLVESKGDNEDVVILQNEYKWKGVSDLDLWVYTYVGVCRIMWMMGG